MEKPNKKLVLENGEVFYGYAFGAKVSAVGEVVFNTAMAGYQEVVSDLGYYDQMIVMSYPIIGSYGVTDEDYESKSLGLKALIVREYNDNPSNFRYTKTLAELLEENGVPGLQGIDTRKLISIIRDQGNMAAALVDIDVPDEEAIQMAKDYVYPEDAVLHTGCKKRWYSRTPNHQYTVVAIDSGIKFQMIRQLNAAKCNVIMVPATITAEEILGLKPDGIFFSNGPGNPKDAILAIELAKKLMGKLPIMGIGLGMQILAASKGAEIVKLKCGHHGSNHPVRNLENGKVEVVTENHCYSVSEQSLDKARLTLTHVDLLDGSVMGIEDKHNNMFALQFYADQRYFQKFVELIKKVLVIGSGPIVIGQAAEFDYAGTQACLALKEEGYEVILANSNPATIMTDKKMADKIYMEPLNLEYIAKIIRIERPDAIVPGLGGQTGLNLAMKLAKSGVLEECNVKLLGTSMQSIEMAEDRECFKEMCMRIGEPVIPSEITYSIEEALKAAHDIGYPVVLRPAFTLGGTGGGFAYNDEELEQIMKNALQLSPVGQVLVEKSVKGYKEIEFEVMRDANDTAIAICSMENLDPVGVHTGDSIVVAPSQTLTNKEVQMLRNSALKIIRELKIEGGCNVQFALNPHSFDYYLIEVNPRVSRSSALASKASGYPIARVTAKVAVGLTLDEIMIANTPACFEPSLDYIVAKVPRFPFDKFETASNKLGTQMKATGEVMSIGRTFEESLLKAIRSLEIGAFHIWKAKFDNYTVTELYDYIEESTDDRIFAIAELLARGGDIGLIASITKIDMFFLEKIKKIVEFEYILKANLFDKEILKEAKRMGFSDKYIAKVWRSTEKEIFEYRREIGLMPVYKMIDTVAGELKSKVQYFYSTYEDQQDSVRSDRKKIIVLGSGPIRIGQGIEFDYSTVHAIWTIQEAGYEAIIINNNPETVSTDYTTSDKLYFEPLTFEDVMNVMEFEKPDGVVVSLGGQTAINLADKLEDMGVPIIGTDVQAIQNAEDRDCFEKIMTELKIPQPNGQAIFTIEDGLKVAKRIGYPVLVRPSYVLGGRQMQIAAGPESLKQYLKSASALETGHAILVDKYIMGKELEVDAVCDGKRVFCPAIMQHIERTGVHSGDSISVYPPFSVNQKVIDTIIDYTVKLGMGIGIVGLYNIQFICDQNNDVYVIEVNPRSSRTVPFISKASGYSLADIGTKVMLGIDLEQQGYTEVYPNKKPDRWYVKAPTFSFSKIQGMEVYLSPEMKSTGEAIGYDKQMNRALYKALKASGTSVQNYGTVFMTIADKDKESFLPIVRRFYDLGFNIEATKGTSEFLHKHGIKSRTKAKLSEGSSEILDSIRKGHVTYVINTRDLDDENPRKDGYEIRRCAVENNVTLFTSQDTVSALLDVLEDITFKVSTI